MRCAGGSRESLGTGLRSTSPSSRWLGGVLRKTPGTGPRPSGSFGRLRVAISWSHVRLLAQTFVVLWVCLEGTNATNNLPYRLHKSATPSPRATFTPNSPMVCLHFHKRHSTNHLAVFTKNIGLMFHLSLCAKHWFDKEIIVSNPL